MYLDPEDSVAPISVICRPSWPVVLGRMVTTSYIRIDLLHTSWGNDCARWVVYPSYMQPRSVQKSMKSDLGGFVQFQCIFPTRLQQFWIEHVKSNPVWYHIDISNPSTDNWMLHVRTPSSFEQRVGHLLKQAWATDYRFEVRGNTVGTMSRLGIMDPFVEISPSN